MTDQTRRGGPADHGTASTSLTDKTSIPRPTDTALPSGVSAWWWSCAVRGLESAASTGEPFDARTLTDYGVPPADHHNHWGVLFAACAARGVIEPTGTAGLSHRSNGRQIAVRLWAGTRDFRGYREVS